MRRRMLAIAAISIVGLCLTLTGCSNQVAGDGSRGPTVKFAVAAGCPSAVPKARDVVNVDPNDANLLPSGDVPNAGLVCIYSGRLNPPVQHLFVTLNADQARQIAKAVLQLSLASPSGTFSCPNDTGGFAILDFSYSDHADVGLWWNTTGCQTLDNGKITAYQAGSATFGHFQKAFDSAADLPGGPYVTTP